MNTSKLADIAEITSSIAILVTLVFLVVQMQQNTEALQATSRQAQLENSIQTLNNAVNTPDIWLDYVNPELTEGERVRLSAQLFIMTVRGQVYWQQYRAGVVDENSWLAFQQALMGTLQYSQPRKWWKFYDARSTFETRFSDYVNEQLETIPVVSILPDVQAFD